MQPVEGKIARYEFEAINVDIIEKANVVEIWVSDTEEGFARLLFIYNKATNEHEVY